MRGFNVWAHQLGLAQQAHQAQGRDRAEVHLLSSLLLPVVQRWLMMEMIWGCECEPYVEIREICVAVHGSSRSRSEIGLASSSAIMMFLTVTAIVIPYLYSELKREDGKK